MTGSRDPRGSDERNRLRQARHRRDHANRILRTDRQAIPGQDRHPLRLGAPPPRPWRRHLHRPARPRGPRAGGERPGPQGDLRQRRSRAQRIRPARDGRGAAAARGNRESGPEERRDRGAGARAGDPQSRDHAAVHDGRRDALRGGAPALPLPRPAPRADAEGAEDAPPHGEGGARVPGRARLHRRGDARSLQVHAGGRARVPRALAHP